MTKQEIISRQQANGFEAFEYEGRCYLLYQDDAQVDNYMDGVCYTGLAICLQDEPDEENNLPLYSVRWDITNEDAEDACDACDWDSPASVEQEAMIDLETGHIF